MAKTDKEQIKQELLMRLRARKNLADWARVCGHEPAKHHKLLIEKLEAVVRGEIKRLAVFLPPGSAKSTYCSVYFPPWFLCQKPRSAILTCSHSTDLAESFGRRSRNLIEDKQTVLNYGLSADSQAAGKWSTTKGGEFFCMGVGGRIAGRRADLGLIDDPVGSREDAYSKIVRDATWDWFQYDFRTRLTPKAAIVLVQTRWHEDDLAGRILATERDEWEVILIPMLAGENDPVGRKPGELLWPEYFTPEMLADAQKDKMVFSALYQQNPTPEDGDFFKKEWIEGNAYDKDDLPPKEELTYYVASDHAVSLNQSADLTCLLPVAVDTRGVVWVLPDIYWQRCDTQQTVTAMIAMMKRRSPRTWWAEKGHISKSIGPFLHKQMREDGVFCYIEEVTPVRDKQTRAQSIRGRLQSGMVRFPKFAHWYGTALLEMLSFPAGKHDDFVDALAHIGMGLDKMVKGSGPRAVSSSGFLRPSNITLKWLKDSDKRVRRRKELALLDR